jgi:hypothetical protein
MSWGSPPLVSYRFCYFAIHTEVPPGISSCFMYKTWVTYAVRRQKEFQEELRNDADLYTVLAGSLKVFLEGSGVLNR